MKVFLVKAVPGFDNEVLVEAVSEKEALKAWSARAALIRKLNASEVLATGGKLPIITAGKTTADTVEPG